jgi:hypothetical protein
LFWVRGVLSFGANRAVARFDLDSECFICTLGFDQVIGQAGLLEIDVGAGLLTALLMDLKPRPRATAAEIKDVIEAQHKIAEPSYNGHDPQLILLLFPTIRAFTSIDVDPEETWRIFFLLCVDESRQGETWIEDDFAQTLRSIAELKSPNVPYRTLCRSIFDADPAAMFLALYRCIEALYAYSSAQNIIRSLHLSIDWTEVAVVLEDELGWHPREESSLASLLSKAHKSDLEGIFRAMDKTVPGRRSDLAASTARVIYKLRNELVHFRPAHHRVDYSEVEWNRLCIATATLVWHLYTEVFPVIA